MIALVQRVSGAAVKIEGLEIARIGRGLLILVGIHTSDRPQEASWVARKCARLRIFRDGDGIMNRSVIDVGGEALVVSQFTLYGNTDKGNRPSYVASAKPEVAVPLYATFLKELESVLGGPVKAGRFGAMMQVELVNDGPVTLLVEKRATNA